MPFLPINRQDMIERGWEKCDFVLVTGDAYVDHPSFGTAVISRVLESRGYRVGILSQPDWKDPRAMLEFGLPRLAFLVNAGNIDSMVAHYTAAKRRRSDDAYTPGGKAGKRPDRAIDVYCAAIRKVAPDSIIVIGGIEASLRRFAHYDYWDDEVRPSILFTSGADALLYGMGERSIVETAEHLERGEPLSELRGLCWLSDTGDIGVEHVSVASYEKVASDKAAYARAHRLEMLEQDATTGRTVVQKHGSRFLVQNPPQPILSTPELDAAAELPYMRAYHPSYEALGGVKAIEEVEFSIIHNRGCFGGCNFCAIAFHQGRRIAVRSRRSVVEEARSFTKNPRFRGIISDVGGPTANFRRPSCAKQIREGMCPQRKCLAPTPCSEVVADHSDYLRLLRELRELPGVRKVFVRSGLRFDYMLMDKDSSFLEELVKHHVSGQLKVAPEHCSDHVLDYMGKPHKQVYEKFEREFYRTTKRVGKEQYLVPYLMSSHPGSRLEDAVELALFLKKRGLRPEQVQDFYPTPGTNSTCMYYTHIDPMTGKSVYVPDTPQEKRMQRALLQYFKPENRRIVIEALERCGRQDLIGRGPQCLVAPDAKYMQKLTQQKQKAAEKPNRSARSARPGKRR